MRYLFLLSMVLLTGCVTFSWVLPLSNGDCPVSHEVKGNADSGYYHLPGFLYYDKVHAEKCFRTEWEAARAGFEKAGGEH